MISFLPRTVVGSLFYPSTVTAWYLVGAHYLLHIEVVKDSGMGSCCFSFLTIEKMQSTPTVMDPLVNVLWGGGGQVKPSNLIG